MSIRRTFHQKRVAAGWDVVANQQAKFAIFIRTEYERYGNIVKSKGIELEQPAGELRK